MPQVPASEAGHATPQAGAGEKTRGEEMLEAYRARQMEAQRSQSSVSPDGQPRSRIPVRGPPPNYQAALRSKQQDLGTVPQSLQGGRGQQTVSCCAVHCITLQCSTSHCRTSHCSTVHCITLQCSTSHCRTSHCSTVHCITLQDITLQHSALHHTAGHHIAAQCTASHCRTSHCSTVHHITLQCITLQRSAS